MELPSVKIKQLLTPRPNKLKNKINYNSYNMVFGRGHFSHASEYLLIILHYANTL